MGSGISQVTKFISVDNAKINQGSYKRINIMFSVCVKSLM